MAYQTGTVNSFADLVTQINAFLVTNGYTNTSGVLTKSGVSDIHMQFSASTTDYLGLCMGKSSSGSTLQEKHPGTAGQHDTVYMVDSFQDLTITWPINYFLHYINSPVEEFWCFIEYNGGYCQHLGFGQIVKATNFEGGVFIDGSYSLNAFNTNTSSILWERWGAAANAYNAVPFGRHTNTQTGAKNESPSTIIWAELCGLDWRNSADTNGTGVYSSSNYTKIVAGSEILLHTGKAVDKEFPEVIQSYNANNVLVPIRLMFNQPTDDNRFRPGDIYGMRYTKNQYLDFGQIMDDGTDQWKVYPVYYKGTQDAPLITSFNVTHTGWWAVAVRYDGP